METNDTEDRDEDLAHADQERFAQRYQELAPMLHAWATLRIRPEMRALVDPQDVVQEVWCRAWRAREELRTLAVPFRAWVFRVAKNVLLEAFRKTRSPAFRAGAAGTTSRVFLLDGVPDSVTAVSKRLARDEQLARLVQWVQGLDEGDRRLMLHVGLEGLSLAEVAERLELSRDVVAKRWQRLRERLAGEKLPREIFAAVG